MEQRRVTAFIIMLMEISMMEDGNMIRKMAMEFIIILLMGKNMKDNGFFQLIFGYSNFCFFFEN